jgi:hypothetical protein
VRIALLLVVLVAAVAVSSAGATASASAPATKACLKYPEIVATLYGRIAKDAKGDTFEIFA